jgi:hypothetical protein
MDKNNPFIDLLFDSAEPSQVRSPRESTEQAQGHPAPHWSGRCENKESERRNLLMDWSKASQTSVFHITPIY